MDREDGLLNDEDDCEGAELTSNPPSPPPSRPPSPSPEPPAMLRRPQQLSTTTGSVEARRRKESAQLRKKKDRQSCSIAADPLSNPRLRIRANGLKKMEGAVRVSVKFNAQHLEGSGASYVGHRAATRQGAPSTVKQLRARGITVKKWDGMCVH